MVGAAYRANQLRFCDLVEFSLTFLQDWYVTSNGDGVHKLLCHTANELSVLIC